MLRRLVPYLVYAYMTFVGWSTRLRTVRGEIPEKIHAGNERFIYAFWHQRQVFFTWSHRGTHAVILISRSQDGEMIAKTIDLCGVGAVRGSSSRGALAAAREMMEALQSGYDIGITPDGPKGPAREVKEGVVFLARKLGAPILPIANAMSLKLEICKAWDRLQVPLPFGRAVVVYGTPIRVGANDDLTVKAAELKAALDRITSEADRLVA